MKVGPRGNRAWEREGERATGNKGIESEGHRVQGRTQGWREGVRGRGLGHSRLGHKIDNKPLRS